MFNLLPLWIKALIVAGIVSAVAGAFAAFIHHERDIGRAEVQAKWDADRVQWQAALAKQKLEAVQTLTAETAKVTEIEQRLGTFLITQEKTDANHEAVVTDLQHRLAGVRLRDPYAAPARCGAGSGGAQGGIAPAAADRAADSADAAGVLSERTSEDLRRLQFAADTINDAYISCRATAVNDRVQQAVKP